LAEDQGHELTGVIGIERTTGHESPVEDCAEQRGGRQLGIDSCRDLAVLDAARD
jgi:hypothetical protein